MPPLRPDLRRARAQALAAHILNAINAWIADPDDRALRRPEREVSDTLYKMFTQAGVEIVTDYDRQQLGLEPRGSDGWTPHEIVALETVRLTALSKPIPIYSLREANLEKIARDLLDSLEWALSGDSDLRPLDEARIKAAKEFLK